eukprot:m.376502 g.376502  ORF g.376502 m.376502 type:complete len:327 (+) comp20017_c4_seq17:1593-2573(+)
MSEGTVQALQELQLPLEKAQGRVAAMTHKRRVVTMCTAQAGALVTRGGGNVKPKALEAAEDSLGDLQPDGGSDALASAVARRFAELVALPQPQRQARLLMRGQACFAVFEQGFVTIEKTVFSKASCATCRSPETEGCTIISGTMFDEFGASTPFCASLCVSYLSQPMLYRATCVRFVKGTHDARFLDDVTFPDNAKCAASTIVTKTWRVLNTGGTTWNRDDVKLATNVDGVWRDEDTTVRTTPPGQTADLSVRLALPSKPGKYRQQWNLRYRGQEFGNPLWLLVDITADDTRSIRQPPQPVFARGNGPGVRGSATLRGGRKTRGDD